MFLLAMDQTAFSESEFSQQIRKGRKEVIFLFGGAIPPNK
jgi:hypothetical protein